MKLQRFNILPVAIIISLLIPGCTIKKLPRLNTTVVTDVGPISATSGGNITSDGHDLIIVRGVCWSTDRKPDLKDSRTTDGFGVGPFTSAISGLLPNTLYHVRAYAVNGQGVAYGNDITFTSSQVSVPILTTNVATSITQTTALSGGNISADGGNVVTARGVCWAAHTSPVITDSKTSDGTGAGAFTSNITGLTGNTRYYVRAYATNSEGTGYGQEISFITSPLIPAVSTSDPSPSSATTANGGGNVTSDGGSPVTARGVCWGTSADPSISGSKTTDGSGTGSFSSTIAGLTANTTYHVRAYATNSVGTAYGTDKTFTTDPLSVTDVNGNIYDVVRIGTQLWMGQNLKATSLNDGTQIQLVTGNSAWFNLTTPGYCWYNNNGANKDIYGALYNWHAVNSGKLCPSGWHVSGDAEWLTLEYYLGGPSPAGGKLKEAGFTHWMDPNTGATNESKFTALPGGWRRDDGTFESLTTYGCWWTSTAGTPPEAYYRRIQYNDDKTYRYLRTATYGMSVRCIKD